MTTSTRLEVAAKSPYLHQLLTSIKMCDGCKEPTTLIFPAEDETQNTLQEMFKSLSVFLVSSSGGKMRVVGSLQPSHILMEVRSWWR